jgi:molybdopterin molybdotransferase
MMISIEEARERVLANLPPRRTERIYFQKARHRVLAEDVRADMDIPPFDRAAVDGYAVRSADVRAVPAILRLQGELRAGQRRDLPLETSHAIGIATGAPIPAGADAVQMLEHVIPDAEPGRIALLKSAGPGQNIVKRGYEAAAGDIVLGAGRIMGAAEIAVLATFGRSEVGVWARPRVALVVTGDELTEIGDVPEGPQIRNSNAYSLTSQLNSLGIDPDYLGIARDDPEELHSRIRDGLNRDVLILSGGASVGPYDLVRSVLEALGVEILFARVAVRPGKPTVFGRRGETLVFGLPGNPVSSMVAFENLVRPALGRMCGLTNPDLERISGALRKDMRQSPGRTAFLPARVAWIRDHWDIDPLPWRGSGDMIGFSRANALVIFPGDQGTLASGARVDALLLPDYFERRT